LYSKYTTEILQNKYNTSNTTQQIQNNYYNIVQHCYFKTGTENENDTITKASTTQQLQHNCYNIDTTMVLQNR